MHQVRQAQDTCPGKFGSTGEEESLSGEVCQDPEHTDSSPFGVDPAFITTSTIGAGLQVHPNNYYENSEINSRGVPYGFYSVEFGRRETGFPILIDVNAEETAFNKVITYLEEGFYLDKYTKSLKVEILTYNADFTFVVMFPNFCSLKQGVYSSNRQQTQWTLNRITTKKTIRRLKISIMSDALLRLFSASLACSRSASNFSNWARLCGRTAILVHTFRQFGITSNFYQ